MEIFDSIDLKGNNLDSSVLNNSVVGSNSLTTAGAIKYSEGKIQYYDGSGWKSLVTIDGGGGSQTVDGYFNLSDGNTTYTVTVSPTTASKTLTFSSSTNGTMNISMPSGNNNPNYEISIPTTYVRVTEDIVISQQFTGGHTISITHGLGTKNVIVQVWYRINNGTDYELVEADVKAKTNDVVVVNVNGVDYAGRYKIVILRGYEQTITFASGDIVSTGQGSPI